MQQLPQELIIKALALTEKTMEDMIEITWYSTFPKSESEEVIANRVFSIEKFCFYLLSPDFIEEFYYAADMSSEWKSTFLLPEDFWIAINFYQDWNPQPLIDLLSKI